nr:hypothetical protein [Leptolyngbya sp. Prado105]
MRLHGHYSIRSQPVTQQDFQISPCAFRVIDGIKLPIRGPFTQVVAQRGIVALYVSQPGETPLYYSMTPGWIHWSEQKLALLGKPKLIEQGTVVIWQAGKVDSAAIDELPCPEIGEVIPQETAIAQYQQCILNAVRLRLKGCRVAVAQSGGADSLLITWALHQLGATVVPMTVCSSTD